MKRKKRTRQEHPIFTLRLTQHAETQPDRYHVEAAFEGKDSKGNEIPRQIANARFNFKLTAQEQEDIRWYLEDYLQYPLDPAPKIAARIEKRMAEIGVELFEAIFQSGEDGRDLWATLRALLNETRVEIVTEVREAAAIPWELIRDPKTDTPLALRAQSFVRAQPTPAQPVRLLSQESGPIRILLVICRPGGRKDVPFRSVAARLIKGLTGSARQAFQLDVLRPPTFERLSQVLREAKAAGKPYHVVHFDGHGEFFDMQELFDELKGKTEKEQLELLAKLLNFNTERFSPELLYPETPREGGRGYLAFENPTSEYNLRFVDGPALGKLLVETNVPLLTLNACQSAFAEALASPQPIGEGDVHTQVRTFGSLAQEVMDAGVAGVVAMRYSVYVVTAAQFVADLYATLIQGNTLGEAVTLGRKQLHDQPLREIAFAPRPLQDWCVPIIYEAAPIALFPKLRTAAKLTISLSDAEVGRVKAHDLPQRPDVGFLGRDETLLALDRAFDTQSIVLLHAYAGSGKTATAAEFARWYAFTGGITLNGVEGRILFTSFEQYQPLPRVLDTIERVFGDMLENVGVHWLALNDEQRREVALQALKQIPILWIWDNVEPIAGFPTGTKSAWSEAEQKELADFLREAWETKAKFLLTSRRDERSWLGDLPARITLPPMPMQECVQLARAITEKYGRRLSDKDVNAWRPLLEFTQGNPLTITVLVGQALRDRRKTQKQIEAFVARLRAGEAAFEDEVSEGRSKSLGASLSYGFEHAFSEDERKQLALLHFFQGFVDVDVLRVMGGSDTDWCLPELSGLTHEAGIALLDRAADIGLLTAHGGGYYSIYTALPWFFKSLFDHYYSPLPSAREGQGVRAARAFVEAMGKLGNYYHSEYQGGNRDVIAALTAEEANLLHARQLARTHGWWWGITSAMQGLDVLYDHTGRRAEWARLVDETVPDFVDPATDDPLPEREEEWSFVTDYRVRLASEARQWAEAERLQRAQVDWTRQRAASALAAPPESLDAAQRNAIRTLAVSLDQLAIILREQSNPKCVTPPEEAISLYQRIGDRAAEAISAFNLGHAYMNIPVLCDLAQAERWYRRGLKLTDERDYLSRGKGLGQLGHVAWKRFKEARTADKPKEELLRHLNAALQFYYQALDLLPPNAVDDLAVTHGQLGNIYDDAGDLDRALHHWREAIRYNEAAGNLYGAAQTRFNVALALAQANRLADARVYADAALRNYETFGDRAAEDIQKTRELIADIEQARKGKGG
ncbi:CHAT domain-containing protein [Candidatus Acetothermia bacterium]|jgi:tetratricopeptide (TPR) repeat protein|nr:CHAT domain-containing protein [Candidatus Acetothermia bacterium]MCI2432487.1 CHAT domain-containing protein [Candidatus Acetothermia bacterium]MCI2436331.1 CHAT domain-containing protein [Candidatus Acetothermia bacterium]